MGGGHYVYVYPPIAKMGDIQPDQINIVVLFWYLVKSNASVRYCTVAYTGQVTDNKVPEPHGHV